MIDELLVFEIMVGVLNFVLLLQVAGLFVSQYRKARESLSLLNAIFFCAFCGSSLAYFLRFFVMNDPIFYRIEVSLRFAAFTCYVYLFEHQVKKHKIPWLTLLCIFCISLLIFLPYEYAYNSGFTIYGATMIVLWFFIKVFHETDGKIHRYVGIAILGGVVLGTGIGISADLMVQTYGNILVAIGLIVELIGMIMIGLSFYFIRTTDEFLWRSNVQSLFIIYNSLSILAYNLEQESPMKQGDLYGGGLASVLIVAQSIIKSDSPPDHIEYQNMNFLIKVGQKQFDGNRCVAVLLVKKNLSILHEKLAQFMERFETQYESILTKWNGNALPFQEQSGPLLKLFQIH